MFHYNNVECSARLKDSFELNHVTKDKKKSHFLFFLRVIECDFEAGMISHDSQPDLSVTSALSCISHAFFASKKTGVFFNIDFSIWV